MLFYLSNEFVHEVINNNQTALTSLDLIAIGRKYGKHLLLSSRNDLKLIRDCEFVSNDTKRVFTHLFENYPILGLLKDKLSFYIRITSGTNHMTMVLENQTNICELSYDYISDINIVTETIVIGENQSEIDFYNYISNYYKLKKGLNSIASKYKPTMGGGQTTHTVFAHEQASENSLCLCSLT